MPKYSIPEKNKPSFHCPHCGTYAQQIWSELYACKQKFQEIYGPLILKNEMKPIEASLCMFCNNFTLWQGNILLYPSISSMPSPNSDMPDEIASIYNEAANVFHLSPRSSAALLRLALQKLMIHLGEKGKNINDDIASLVRKGLNPKVQEAADIIRHTGNQAVHPGTIDFNDSSDTASSLFMILNFIVDQLITIPKHIDTYFDDLPKKVKDGIQKRDKTQVRD